VKKVCDGKVDIYLSSDCGYQSLYFFPLLKVVENTIVDFFFSQLFTIIEVYPLLLRNPEIMLKSLNGATYEAKYTL